VNAFAPALVALSLVVFIAWTNHKLYCAYEREYDAFLKDQNPPIADLVFGAVGHLERTRCYVQISPVPVFFLLPPIVAILVQLCLWTVAIVKNNVINK